MMPLFVTDDELGKILFGRRSAGARGALAIFEKRGLPPVDAMLGMRYFPAVRQFLDTWYGVGIAPIPCSDGHENGWAARKPKKIRDVV